MFLTAYFFTFVLANLAYPFSFGGWLLEAAAPHVDVSTFAAMYTPGYWILLFLPFAIAPLVAATTRATLTGIVCQAAKAAVEFRSLDYTFILAACYCYVLFAFWRADAFTLAWEGENAGLSVTARFQLLAALGYWPQMILKSLLMFLFVYSFVMALRSRTAFWNSAFAFNLIAMSLLLLHLNMKWPLLVLYISGMLCVFLWSGKRPYAKAALIFVAVVAVYVAIALSVMRLLPSITIQIFPKATATLLVGAVNRMAVGYPFYYQVFTEQGPICGTVLDRIQRKPSACHPSILISQKIAGDNPLGDGITQPAPVHVSGYALGGWPSALIALAIASMVIGVFTCLPFGAHANATVRTMTIMGGLAGYYFSQLPVEGAIMYDHGIIWWLALCATYAIFHRLIHKTDEQSERRAARAP
jgi:hypothetical protein